ncbi:hypothetical protein [Streptomyces sp. ISL-100]|uniref:hypothetical protein n=1 Tax=Streptomyces sp. ISL-100 TaxID=2819173 RepID=UPI001BE7FE09|nr:hypothetical protein [Streptomyces sp. ISL-100]MBT2395388.1 hypothetical protein [Streptomyces sp. ISL-100]
MLVVVKGRGELVSASGDAIAISRGATVLTPFAAGPLTLRGGVEALRCRPPRA